MHNIITIQNNCKGEAVPIPALEPVSSAYAGGSYSSLQTQPLLAPVLNTTTKKYGPLPQIGITDLFNPHDIEINIQLKIPGSSSKVKRLLFTFTF